MDPITLIMRAIETGNVPDIGMQSTMPDSILEAYDNITGLVAARLALTGNSKLLEDYQDEPDLYEGALIDALQEAAADTDEELIAAAQQFMEWMETRRGMRGDFTADIPDDIDEEDTSQSYL